MNTFLVIVLIVLVAMVVVSLVRGIIAFMQSSREEIDRGTGESEGATELQLKQNKMMFARIKYQAAAVLVVVLIMLLSS